MSQDKAKEVEFFNRHADSDEYNVFSDAANEKIVDTVETILRLPKDALVADLGCGSGVFSALLVGRGYRVCGVDLSFRLVQVGATRNPQVRFAVGDVDQLPLQGDTFDGIVLSGLIHHLPDPTTCAAEVFRALKPGGRFVAFDPNRRNPFMYLYRDRSSPFYSPIGVTENERPVLAERVAATFKSAGFRVRSDYLSGLEYRYVASKGMRLLLPVYNFLDSWLFRPAFMKPLSAMVLTYGLKV